MAADFLGSADTATARDGAGHRWGRDCG